MNPTTENFIISIDQGTTGNRVFCYNHNGEVVSSIYEEFTQHYPQPGWVEHDPEEIFQAVSSLLERAIRSANLRPEKALGIGITNQRETTVIWDRATGKPVYNAIVWQCRRTAPLCNKLKNDGHEDTIREKTGLVIDAYFSSTKIRWILDNVEGAQKRAENGELCAGTMDSWLLYKLTGEFKTDHTNASRTMLYNLRTGTWDPDLLKLFNVPISLLPEIKSSAANFGKLKGISGTLDGIPVLSMAGDQQAALFGQLCTDPGQAKNTYGTGAFLLFHTGQELIKSHAGLLTTRACDANGNPAYALEGSIFIAGAVIQWLRDYMGFFAEASDTEQFIMDLGDEDDDIVVVPAFAGLGAPHWDMNARGAIFGLTRDTTPARITRASLKSIALQTRDLIVAMEKDTGKKMESLHVDGGATQNGYLMQYQSDILNIPVHRPFNIDTTALGAAYLAGLQCKFWDNIDEIKSLAKEPTIFTQNWNDEKRNRELNLWTKAIDRTRGWLD